MTPLQTELARPEYTGLSDAEAAARINAPVITRRLVPLADFVYRFFSDATWATLAAAAAAEPSPLQAAARTVYDYLRNPHVQSIDMDLAATKSVLAELVAASVLTQDLVNSIDALANVRVRRAATLGVPPISAHLINIVRKGMPTP